jgi:GTP-binding protein
MPGFADRARIFVAAGAGGDGASTFRREAHVPRGGPDGGDGGKGGDVVLTVEAGQTTLGDFQRRRHFRADPGGRGTGRKAHGRSSADVLVRVPPGTVVRSHPEGEWIGELLESDDRLVVARGGRGGRGNARFATPTNRAPRHAEKGTPGEERWVELELKLIADIGLVGAPNAGKSTLLAALTEARPEVGAYPFTTISPNLGVLALDADRERLAVIADVPGLIEGAHEGKGLGHQFLRHIERARALLILVDLAMVEGTSPAAQERVLLHELASYRPELLDRPRLVVGSRADLEGLVGPPHPEFTGLRLSAVTGQGLGPLVGELVRMVDAARQAEPVSDAFVVHRPDSEGFRVARAEDGAWVVEGRVAERAVALSDLTNLEALDYARQRLEKLGVNRALLRAGAREGDTVRIGRLELEYAED